MFNRKIFLGMIMVLWLYFKSLSLETDNEIFIDKMIARICFIMIKDGESG